MRNHPANWTSVEEVEVLLSRCINGRVRNLRVTINDSHVTLRGQACRFYDKQLAQHFAMELIGLPNLVNQIEVT